MALGRTAGRMAVCSTDECMNSRTLNRSFLHRGTPFIISGIHAKSAISSHEGRLGAANLFMGDLTQQSGAFLRGTSGNMLSRRGAQDTPGTAQPPHLKRIHDWMQSCTGSTDDRLQTKQRSDIFVACISVRYPLCRRDAAIDPGFGIPALRTERQRSHALTENRFSDIFRVLLREYIHRQGA